MPIQPSKDVEPPNWFKIIAKSLIYAVITGVLIGISLTVLALVVKFVIIMFSWMTS
jgi:hypothetical protein